MSVKLKLGNDESCYLSAHNFTELMTRLHVSCKNLDVHIGTGEITPDESFQLLQASRIMLARMETAPVQENQGRSRQYVSNRLQSFIKLFSEAYRTNQTIEVS